jgi:hypothetical protein
MAKLSTIPCQMLFFSSRDLWDASNKLYILRFGPNFLKKSLYNWKKSVFFAFFRSLTPRRVHQHSKFWKVIEQKLFLISIHIFFYLRGVPFCVWNFPIQKRPSLVYICLRVKRAFIPIGAEKNAFLIAWSWIKALSALGRPGVKKNAF